MTSISTDQNGWATGTLQTSQGNPEQYVPQSSWVNAPVYKWASATVPVTTEITSDSSSFTKLLESKVKQAHDDLQRDLEGQLLYGKGRYVRNEELRRCVGDAYEKHINQNIMSESSVLEALRVRKADMNNEAVSKVMAERQEDRAREALVVIDEWLEEYEVGSVRSWTTQFDAAGKTYNYAAVYAKDGLWYITNRVGGMKTEVLKALLAEQAVEAHEVVLDNGTIL